MKRKSWTKRIDYSLDTLRSIRKTWDILDDPGIGSHPAGDSLRLVVTHHKAHTKNGSDYTQYLLIDTCGEPVCMARSWESFLKNILTKPYYERDEMKNDTMKDDDEMREKIRLKCKNDWDLDLTEDQISVCIIEMEETNLSIFHNHLWPNQRKVSKQDSKGNWTSYQRIVWDKTIDGYRTIAHRTGLFAGVDSPEFVEEKGDDGSVELMARVTVYRVGPEGRRNPFVGEARFSEFVQLIPEYGADKKKTGKKVPNHVWAEKPKNQLSIAAERQALRKAFQACEDSQLYVSEGGEELGQGDALGIAEVRAESKPESRVEEKVDEKLKADEKTKEKGKYVGVPKSGFKLFSPYNKDERIMMLARLEGQTALALDSGFKVIVSSDGYETQRLERSDNFKGGRQWQAGDKYIDGSEILKVSGSKKDANSIRLLLDCGYEVRLDRWGKEYKRKPYENKGNKKESKDKPKKEEKKEKDPKGEASGPVDLEVDLDDIDSVEDLRKITLPLLKSWCEKVLKRRVSPKGAYEELTGVVLDKGQAMSLDDYKVLYLSLEEALEA